MLSSRSVPDSSVTPAGRLRPAGRVRPAFNILLMAAVVLGSLPVLEQMQRLHRVEAAIATLADHPIEEQARALASRSEQFHALAEAYQSQLSQAEGALWNLRTQREPALILKDVGNAQGELGGRELLAGYAALGLGLAELRILALEAGRDLIALRASPRGELLDRLTDALGAVSAESGRQRALLTLYRGRLRETQRHVQAFRRLAPQAAGIIPRPVATLPVHRHRLEEGMGALSEVIVNLARPAASWPVH